MRALAVLLAVILAGCTKSHPLSNQTQTGNTQKEWLPSGGKATVMYKSGNTFLQFIPNLHLLQQKNASQGRELFVAQWEAAPSGRPLLDGLGPLFVTDACSKCHLTDSRAASLKKDGTTDVGILFRLADKKGNPDPHYGSQLQDKSTAASPEGRVIWTLSGNNRIKFHLTENKHALDEKTVISPRLAPPLFGMGLLNLVSEKNLLEYADEEDKNKDGISGRAHILIRDAKQCLGRFGLKAITCNLKEQTSAAFNGDMGLTSALKPKENCTDKQPICKNVPSGGNPEVSQNIVDLINQFLSLLAVYDRRIENLSDFNQGSQIFADIGCEKCHRETLKTVESKDFPQLSEQIFYPYTDLLLHDMGKDLNDGMAEENAKPEEWKTPPLWGIGLIEQSPNARFLHDARAKNIDEAIIWHGGEALKSKQAYQQLKDEDKRLLLSFLRSI